MKRHFIIKLTLCSLLLNTLFIINNIKAVIIEIPNEFPGHQSRIIQKPIIITDQFNPEDYKQERAKNEGACAFNSFLAGIMHTPYGREQIKSLFQLENNDFISIKFHFPSSDVLEDYNKDFYESEIKTFNENIKYYQDALESETKQESEEDLTNYLKENQQDLDEAPIQWQEFLTRSETIVSVPKKFIYRDDKGSFPTTNPNWVNLLQQAYMIFSKTPHFTPYSYWGWGYAATREIKSDDAFAGVPHCHLLKNLFIHINTELEIPLSANILCHFDQRHFEFLPLINIPLKGIEVALNENGLDLNNQQDSKIEKQDDNQITCTKINYSNLSDFLKNHDLTKKLFTLSNVLQFSTAGHAVALFFNNDKVYYYDNVYYPEQIDVYGHEGPIYEEAKYFKGLEINAMSEEEFFTRIFQEIDHRIKQVATIRKTNPHPYTRITFFEKPLVQ